MCYRDENHANFYFLTKILFAGINLSNLENVRYFALVVDKMVPGRFFFFSLHKTFHAF